MEKGGGSFSCQPKGCLPLPPPPAPFPSFTPHFPPPPAPPFHLGLHNACSGLSLLFFSTPSSYPCRFTPFPLPLPHPYKSSVFPSSIQSLALMS